jgi:hypothetical protein
MKEIKLRNFWPQNDTTKKFLVNLIEDCRPDSMNVALTSVFPETSLTRKGIEAFKVRRGMKLALKVQQRRLYNLLDPLEDEKYLNIWYTGENLRPPSETKWDALLTFEEDNDAAKNIYLPFWATTLGETIEEAEEVQKILLLPRNGEGPKNSFACAVIGNPEPMRMRMIKELENLGKVNLFGSVFNNRVKDKKTVLQKHTFNVCFENDLYPGYVTEKALDAWLAGAIPIWWGLDKFNYLNPKAIINIAQLGFDGGIKIIDEISANISRMSSIQSEPILQKGYDYKLLKSKLTNYLQNK